MSLRAKLRPPTHFVVYFSSDKTWFLASKSRVLYDGVPKIDSSYSVQWGSKTQVDPGRIVFAGDSESARDKFNSLKGTTIPEPSVPAISTSAKRRINIPDKAPAKKKKEECRVFATVSPPRESNDAFLLSPETAEPEHLTLDPEPLQRFEVPEANRSSTPREDARTPTTLPPLPQNPARRLLLGTPPATQTRDTPATLTPDTPATQNRDTPQHAQLIAAINRLTQLVTTKFTHLENTLVRKVDYISRRVTTLEHQVTDVRKVVDNQSSMLSTFIADNSTPQHVAGHDTNIQIEDLQSDLPDNFTIPIETLREMHKEAKSPGNFALKLVIKLFPELFGPERLRFEYNWNGTMQKKALDPIRKNIIQRYVFYFYPSYRTPKFWQPIINSINEGLRRKDKKGPTNAPTSEPATPNDDPSPPSSPLVDGYRNLEFGEL